ncbi:response regulator [Roseomonas sp. HJA6]|uniref:histidine kinase n=1 Tax=Roseomonas alba TaxID=2846776 RepID=A0ABS7AJ77_9PROT|nr:chemotaxis protein CheB [Neoroseomonas alba]MBW6401390.1 response regulator [Neoroseomonas alba]
MPRQVRHPAKTTRPGSSRSPPPNSDPAAFPVVGIGASAGGLEACRKLLDALPAGTGMAFILIQHLDPTHESMMGDLLAGHTTMRVRQATDGMRLEREHLYLIPPGTYLSVRDGALHLSQPQARHGARLPFDFLLHSLAEACGSRAVCVILSGTGADGSLGAQAVKAKGGLVIAQDPGEADFDGMPRSAIATGAVDLVLPASEIPRALTRPDPPTPARATGQDRLPDIIALLTARTAHDFTLYKPGTLRRRIERRMAMAAVKANAPDAYLDLLRRDTDELDRLARDLLIHVTSFFRDPKTFDVLEKAALADLVRGQPTDRPLRVWIAGCSTGEEAYSLAMLCLEQIAAAARSIRLQVFASDIDPEAVATAREGLYPDSIVEAVSPARLARFFTKEEHGYRVVPELRAAVIFAVQDILADPPFSRLDLISCRNLLIYLNPEAQSRVIALFHFALRPGGVLLLGSAETVGSLGSGFATIAKAERIYRHVGHGRPGELALPLGTVDGARVAPRLGSAASPARPVVLAELCRRLVMEAYAPAAVLVDRQNACLYSLGPTDRYLRVAPGPPTHDLLAMAPPSLRTRLRAAIRQASQGKARVIVAGGQVQREGAPTSFSIDVRPVSHDGDTLYLICFVDTPTKSGPGLRAAAAEDLSRVAELEQELEATRLELQGTIHSLELAAEEQKTLHEEALSVNEEYQSANEELLTSKEELQSLNEELTALNSQLQETLERQRTTSDDLQNVLYSTDVATLFLDTNLRIRFFTPATKALFHVIANDVGRPLSDLRALAADDSLLADARAVLKTLAPSEREIEAPGGGWFMRRILPYRTHDARVEGVVMTFTDITERKHAARALEEAKQLAEQASVAKSRFLAAASHDLRQPLQTLVLLQGLLSKADMGAAAQKLVALLEPTLSAMTSMLNTLLDINRIETGTVSAELTNVPVNDILSTLREEYTYHARARGLVLRVVPCSLTIHTDPRLLEQVLRNLLSNALKYTRHGKVLLGCRRRAGGLRIEIWDTGIGIAPEALQAIFEEYHQADNAARERSRGLGLGLSIVRRLAAMLGHAVRVRSRPGHGSVFTIDVALATEDAGGRPPHAAPGSDGARRRGMILVVEDDPEVRDLLALVLQEEGHQAITAPDGIAALEMVSRRGLHPDLVLADYNLPGGMDGVQFATTLRERLRHQVPVIMLTGDISTDTLQKMLLLDCVRLHKPIRLPDLTEALRDLLGSAVPASSVATTPSPEAVDVPVIVVIDDDSQVRAALRAVLEDEGRLVEDYANGESFLDSYRPGREVCLLVDARLPGIGGLELLRKLQAAGHELPAIMITGQGDVRMAVQAMRAGAADFIEKPVSRDELLAGIDRALDQARDSSKRLAWHESAARRIAGLTARQREVMERVLAGHPSKNIAADLGISQRTVENHRAAVMRKTGAASLPALARLALAADGNAEAETHGSAGVGPQAR